MPQKKTKKSKKAISNLQQLAKDRKEMEPVQISDKVLDDICEALEVPLPLKTASELNGVPYKNLKQAVEMDPSIGEKIMKAQAKGIKEIMGLLKEHTRKWWQAGAWMLERIHQEQFSLVNRKKTEVEGTVELVIKSNIPRPELEDKKEEGTVDAEWEEVKDDDEEKDSDSD